jgi:vanillate O-demethylase ferredoxin subunit
MNDVLLDVRVAARTVEAEGIVSFELVSASGAPLPSFSAGSHIDVHVPGANLIRQYSLCNDPAENHRYQIAVLRDPESRGGSKALHENVRVGDALRISAPRNHFVLAHEAQSHVLVAGGIGITPLLCMAERLYVLGADFELHYCAKSAERAAFRQRIQASGYAQRVQFHFSAAQGRPDLTPLVGAPGEGRHLYVCGPKAFMDAVLASARAQGWAEECLHYEFFEGISQAQATAGDSFEVKLASSGRVVTVPSGQSVIEALERIGMSIPFSCSEGICGTCVTRVLEGTPDHRDMVLSPAEHARNDQFTPCCSRAKSARLVLDI